MVRQDVVEDPRRRMSRWRRPSGVFLTLLFAGAVVLAATGLRTVYFGDTLVSRLASVYALTVHGTWSLDATPNPFAEKTVDKVLVNGRMISSKPPLLPLAMTGEYWVLHKLFGWSLEDKETWKPVSQAMNATFVAAAYLLMLLFFAGILSLLMDDARLWLYPFAALAFGSHAAGFCSQMNNHVPGACMLAAALYFGLGVLLEKRDPAPWRFAAFGFAAALVFALDMPMTIFVAAVGLGLAYKFPRQTFLWGGLGAAGPLCLHAALMVIITGSPIPVQTNRAFFLYESSPWRNPTGVDGLNEPKGTYLFHITFGRKGAFLMFPVLLTGVLGAAIAAVRRDTPLRGYILAGAAAFAILTAYYVKSTNNYGGSTYGFRWYLGAAPVLLLMGLPVYLRARRGWHWALLAGLLAVSMYSAWECYRSPWGDNLEWTCRWVFGPTYNAS